MASAAWAGDISDCARKLEPKKTVVRDVSLDWVAKQKAEMDKQLSENPELKKNIEAAHKNGVAKTSVNQEILKKHNPNYTNQITPGAIKDQKASGRCWIFGGCTALRNRMVDEKRVPENFNFSENYLHFFNMLEKSNSYLVNVIRTLKTARGLTMGKIKAALAPGGAIGDGGWYEYFQFLVEKYGLVPAEVMPETVSSGNTKLLLAQLQEELGAQGALMFAYTQTKVKEKVPPAEISAELYKMREVAMGKVFKLLVAHLGTPPSEFEYLARAGGDNEVKMEKFTPQQFAKDVVGFKAEDLAVVSAQDLLPEGKSFVYRNSGIGQPGAGQEAHSVHFLNTNIDRLSQLVMASIDAGEPVWFAADVGSDIDSTSGIMHPQIFDMNGLVVNGPDVHDIVMDREGRFFTSLLSPNHAMVITGYDRPDPTSGVVKFKVENSWGTKVGDKGVFHMYAEWFAKNVVQIVIPKSVLSPEERLAFDSKVHVLGGSPD